MMLLELSAYPCPSSWGEEGFGAAILTPVSRPLLTRAGRPIHRQPVEQVMRRIVDFATLAVTRSFFRRWLFRPRRRQRLDQLSILAVEEPHDPFLAPGCDDLAVRA